MQLWRPSTHDQQVYRLGSLGTATIGVSCQEAAFRHMPLVAGSVSPRPRHEADLRVVGIARQRQLTAKSA